MAYEKPKVFIELDEYNELKEKAKTGEFAEQAAMAVAQKQVIASLINVIHGTANYQFVNLAESLKKELFLLHTAMGISVILPSFDVMGGRKLDPADIEIKLKEKE